MYIKTNVLRVSTKSNPSSVAGAIAAAYKDTGSVEIQIVGGGAMNQAVKAVAIARGFLAPAGVDLITIPFFREIEIRGEERTAMVLRVEDRGR